jgi:hypothetical protein
MSMTAEIVTELPRGRGRPVGSKNRPGHRAGRPKKCTPRWQARKSPWRNGRLFVEVTEEQIRKGLERDSSHCVIALALAAAAPTFRHISVDLQSIRTTDPKKHLRYTWLTPHLARDIVVNTDQGLREKILPCTFSIKPAIIAQSGKKRATPTKEQLKGSGLKLADQQPHVPATWQERHLAASAVVVNGGEGAEAEVKRARKPRQPRALVAQVRKGEVPVQLGGRPPPVSILSRREYGMRQLRK